MMQCTESEKSEIMSRLNIREMENAYPNPGDRLVKSVLISKWQRKELFHINYSGYGSSASKYTQIYFYIDPDEEYRDWESISVLGIEEESASFILPFISDVYPYFYDRYYSIKNHLPPEMWEDIVKRISEAKDMILNDTFNPKLKPYIEEFDLRVFANGREREFWQSGEYLRIEKEPEKYLYEHRYDVAHLYDVFIEWSNIQVPFCKSMELLFNIPGL